MDNILGEIVMRRRKDLQRLGPTFGSDIPGNRERPSIPFLSEPGVVLEIKRASPSKGPIAMDLNPVVLAAKYGEAGARQISILTERRYFKGSLDDLVAVGRSTDYLSLMRKDFILSGEEIEVSYRAGADAVLLIAGILETDELRAMAAACRRFGMTPFVEVREETDIEKLLAVASDGEVVAGVNSRDLKTFRIDSLVPAVMRDRLPCKTVFESGVLQRGMARYARSLGYEGLLIGEAAARNPEGARDLVDGFLSSHPDASGAFWREMGKRLTGARGRPLVKVCGLTDVADALYAADLGADLLGFVFAQSIREASESAVRQCADALKRKQSHSRPLLVGVVTDVDSPQAHQAFALACGGVLDAIQYHGPDPVGALASIDALCGDRGIGRYVAVGVQSMEDLGIVEALTGGGEPRVLIDARVKGKSGGTGHMVDRDVVRKAAARGPLWLAGGIGLEHVRHVVELHHPELIDVSSRLESSPGHKDHRLLKEFFKELNR